MFDASDYHDAEWTARHRPSALNWGRLAWAYAEQRRFVEARGAIAKSLNLDPSSFDAKSISLYLQGVQSRDDAEAVKCFISAISLKRNIPRFHYNLAERLAKLRELGFALAEFQITLQLGPKNTSLEKERIEMFEYLRPLFASDKPEDLLQIQCLALSTLTPDPRTLLKVAKECAKQNRTQYALYYLKWTCDIDSSNAEAWHLYAQTLFELDRKPEAIEASKRARSEGPEQELSQSQMDAIRFASEGVSCEDPNEAIKHFVLALEKDPHYSPWQKLLAEAYFRAEKYEDLISFIDKHNFEGDVMLLMQDHKDTALERLKSLQYSRCVSEADEGLKTGNWRKAILKFSEAIELQESPAEVYFGRSRAYAKGRKFVEALADVSIAVEKDPENDHFLFQQAQIYQSLKEFDKAYHILRPFLLSQPDNKQFKAAYRNLLGTLSSGREALEHFSAAIEADPNVSIYYCNRATTYNAMGKYFSALEDVHAALKIDKLCPEALVQEAIALEGLGILKSEDVPTDFGDVMDLKDEVFEKLRSLFASDKPEDVLQVQSVNLKQDCANAKYSLLLEMDYQT